MDTSHLIHCQTFGLCHIFEDAKDYIEIVAGSSFYPSVTSMDFYIVKVVLQNIPVLPTALVLKAS